MHIQIALLNFTIIVNICKLSYPTCYLKVTFDLGGYSHAKTYGDVPQFWVVFFFFFFFFLKEIPKHGSHFYEKFLTMGVIFKISGVRIANPGKILKKIAKNGYLFSEKLP